MRITEKELEEYLVEHLELFHPSLRYVINQIELPGGIPDIMAYEHYEDDIGPTWLIELKVGNLDDKALGQILRYHGLVLAHFLKDDTEVQLALCGRSIRESLLPACELYNIRVFLYEISLDGLQIREVTEQDEGVG